MIDARAIQPNRQPMNWEPKRPAATIANIMIEPSVIVLGSFPLPWSETTGFTACSGGGAKLGVRRSDEGRGAAAKTGAATGGAAGARGGSTAIRGLGAGAGSTAIRGGGAGS